MITAASTADVLAAIDRARSVTFSAYVLRPGRVLSALEAASRRGASVTVRLEGRPYGGADPAAASELTAANQAAVDAIRAAGGDAALTDAAKAGGSPLHMKAAVCDGVAYLDDRNWPDDGQDTIVRDDFAPDAAAVRATLEGKPEPASRFFWTQKARALAGETRLLYEAANATEVDVESESFGYDGAYGALKALGSSGVHCKLLVAQRDVTPQSQAALERLKQNGVDVRVGGFDEKMALVGHTRAWVGSANATFGNPRQIDWGLRTDAPDVVRTLQAQFDAHWNASTVL